MDTRLLSSFLTVVRAGRITAAATELGFVQSTVTMHIQTLERLAGTPLLDRNPGGVTATHAGSALAAYARQILDIEERMFTELAATTTEPAGRVRVYAPESVCAYFLAPALPEVRTRFPDITVSLFPANTRGALTALADRSADLALVLEPSPSTPQAELVDLGIQQLSLVAAATTTLPQHRPITPWELTAAGVLLLEEGCAYSDELAALLASADPLSLPPRFGGIETLKRCVTAGLGLALLPTVSVTHELAEGQLVELQAPDGLTQQHLWLATPSSKWQSPAVRAIHAGIRDIASNTRTT